MNWDDDLEAYVSMVDAEGGGWGHHADQGADDWDLVGGDDHTTGVGNAFISADVGDLTDKWMVSQTLGLSSTSVLTFWHKYEFETGYDGGVIEISVDDGANWVDLGPAITTGGYNDTISTSFSSPIGGRDAWSGDQLTFTEVTVDLSTFDGEVAKIRWRMGCDTSVDAGNWLIDDFAINDTGIGGPCDTVAVEDFIFADGFETGNALNWSGVLN